MPIRYTEEMREAEREQELQDRRDAAEQRAERYLHEEKLAQISLKLDGRYKTTQRVVAAFCKALSLPLAILCVAILSGSGREVPQVLEDFLRL